MKLSNLLLSFILLSATIPAKAELRPGPPSVLMGPPSPNDEIRSDKDEVGSYNDRTPNYGYPFKDTYFATLTMLLFSMNEIEELRLKVPPLPGRMSVPLLEKRAAEFYVASYIQPRPAPVIFLIPGLGSGPNGGKLVSELYKMGYSVISPPSPSHWHFVLAQSKHGMTGYLAEDVIDLYRVLTQAVDLAKRKHGLKPTSYRIMGISMGASHAAHLWKMDKSKKHFNFKKVILINPPIDMTFSMRALDDLYEIGENWSQTRSDNLWGKAIGYAEKIFQDMQRGQDVMASLPERFPLHDKEIRFLIGDSFRRSFRDSLHVIQQMRDTGYFKTPVSKNRLNARLDEIKKVGYEEFMRNIAHPFWKQKLQKSSNWTFEKFLMELNVDSLFPEMALDPSVYFFSNTDDFVTEGAVSHAAALTFGHHGYLYPSGGHCGNLWYTTNTEDLKKVLQ